MMARGPTLLVVALLLVLPLFSGCLGIGGEDGEGATQKNRAQVDAQTGGIQGVVTDASITPVAGINVTLVETGDKATTASDGSYAFSRLQPGSYTVLVNATGFVSSQQEAQVQSDQVAAVDFVLARLQLQQAFTQLIEFSAFIECGNGVQWNLSALPSPPGPIDPRTFAVTVATCAILNLQGNTTNDDFLENLEFEAPLTESVWEAQWDPGGNALAERLWFVADVQGFANFTGGNATFVQDINAESPWRAHINTTTFEQIATFFHEKCESGTEDGERYCGYNFRDQGWPVTVRTFTATDCVDAPASTCAPLQLKVDHVWTAFYNQPAPADYAVLSSQPP